MLSEKSKADLEKLGLRLFDRGDYYHIMKRIGVGGNVIPNFKSIPIIEMNKQGEVEKEIYSDCPSMTLSFSEGSFQLSCWDWVPGPGPGDFDFQFSDEGKLLAFIKSYYFEANEYFESRKQYEIQSRDTINVAEIKLIFEKLLAKLEKEFSDREIAFGARGTFHKIPYDTWRIREAGEHAKIDVTTGFLKNEVFALRKKLSEAQAFNYEDVNHISDLLFELSLLLREKE